MSERDFPFIPQDVADVDTAADGIPVELLGDPKRQAVHSISGGVYQAWCSIDAWLRLTSADEVIYLEGAEDFDLIRKDGAVAVQVKRNSDPISLAYGKARDALENFWSLVSKDRSRHVAFQYLTTSTIAMEKDASFDGLSGIEAWRVARTSLDMTAKLVTFLVGKLDAHSPLRSFLATSTTEEVQQQLIQRVHWLTDQPDIDVVKQSVDDRITVFLRGQRQSVRLAPKVQKHLWSRFWEIIIEKVSANRCLTLAELLRQVEEATTAYLPLPVDQLPDLLANANPGLGLLNLLLEKTPKPPEPLLSRPALTQQLENLVIQRRVVLLTGTVHKGKSTIAQLVASTLCPDAWWVNLTGRRLDQVDNLFLALAGRIENGDCPGLVIIDDLNISPNAHRVYRDSLSLVLHRAGTSGYGVLLTSQEVSSELISTSNFKNIEILDVPELSTDEVQILCVEHGCAVELASIWASLVWVWTKGHPKLVQVRIAELVARGWPSPSSTDMMQQSSAVVSERHVARRLLSESVSTTTAEFVYTVSESSVPLARSVGIQLAESIDGLSNAGDVLDSLIGKWFERLDGNRFRTTSLLHGAASEVWSQEKRKLAHIRLHDAILAKKNLDPAEAASLLFHAFIAGDRKRLALTALRLQMIKGHEAKREVERQLLWLPLVALEPGQSITNEPFAAATLRGLQFRVASTLDADSLPQICERWVEETELITHPEAKAASQAMMWFSIGSAECTNVPLLSRLEAIMGISTLSGELQELEAESTRKFFNHLDSENYLPPDGTLTQIMLLSAVRCVRDTKSLLQLVQWLDQIATDDMRRDFDSMLEWPLVQGLGAFVHSAWAAKHEETTAWEPWLQLFAELDDYAKRRGSSRLGREAAKAKAIILTEYLDRSQEALDALKQAELSFGSSSILVEQRANVLFQVKNDEKVLDIWNELTRDSSNKIVLDPFACRRAAMSAARLKRWSEAEQIFCDSANSIEPGTFEVTKFGLKVDGALTASLGGRQASAARLLGEAVLALPEEASNEGDDRWEAVQRVASEVCGIIESALKDEKDAEIKFEPGYASSPDRKVSKVEAGQIARSKMIRARILKLNAMLGLDLPHLDDELKILAASRYFLVRLYAVQAQLAQAFRSGAGVEFIECLLAFDATVDSVSRRDRGKSLLIPDDGVEQEKPSAPERWFGFLAAGICCAGHDLAANLPIWLDVCQRKLDPNAPLTIAVQQIINGATLASHELEYAVMSPSNPVPLRCGAAARLLMEPLTPDKVLSLQCLLTSALVNDDSYAFQGLFNHHVARRFSEIWRAYSQSPFLFYSPRTSIPELISTLNDVEHENGTLRTLLLRASKCLHKPLGNFMVRVW
ncbi:MAG: hypothetical protein A2X82_14110 [Geobacteraceae bacterium GWC2_55_20]|nr:MAG: hypothetical protein A2X82_14110 [Geobacteraceae bacterium GWC2_55_20]HCE69378.1 hypothetical protein [Geobacter sp.]